MTNSDKMAIFNKSLSPYQRWLEVQVPKWKMAHEQIAAINENNVNLHKNELKNILTELKDTELGRKYEITSLLKQSGGDIDKLVELYRSSIPVSDYDTIIDYVKRMINDGESNLIIPSNKVALYAHTSGTTGKLKYYPIHVCRAQLLNLLALDQNYMFYQQHPKLFDENSKELFLYTKSPDKKAPGDGKPICVISWFAYQAIAEHKNYLENIEKTDSEKYIEVAYPPTWRLASPPEAYEVLNTGHLEPYYMHILFALKQANSLF
ncbi:unnamed protein product [Didymodactylos carnosus]|uniref:Uncharacterized protein n=1 Tax=Didymodactylos carnosus TaxID=1234261 RepID=A0A814FW30_9BILA|nr:unnamed protein product [Didymodactylos carnosus]CAF0990243.1 unnamed protein product [Didymodactylos carnosus]CAF3710241.1 unnamed protein product [Didymodactylos carnosus]CAF3762274.1 unnamed protein product [Didymodactylos carnosus]